MTEPPGFHIANVHAVEAGHRQYRLHDALGILLSGFTVGQKASQPVNRCHNATFIFSSVGKRIAWVYFNHSWPGAGNINSEFAILAGAYYARSYPLTLTLSLREREPPGNRYSPGIHRGANAHAHDERKITPTPPLSPEGEGTARQSLPRR